MKSIKKLLNLCRVDVNEARDKLKKVSLFLLLCSPITSYAGQGDTPVSQGLGYITTALTGSTGIMIATLAIMGVGLGCLAHKIEWKMFAYTVAAIGIVFGAGGIVTTIKGLIS